ncbi:GMP synthase [glutamine-hydrolyzing] [Planctomycetes bacterium Pan216]|uniref:GMP synthase [glutamine-hydrolyzing] n=1 Tax=Kolteria novifilia TaxID=2527975 RepID=A0A518B6E1_9BACT|nr:GMP synthase [glutamine-hydrolyzing] [Planctomycetes bacterium Pan216]
MVEPRREKVLVLDFGSQYAQLIARRVREQHVFCEIVRHDLPASRVRELAPMGIILSGGPSSVYDSDAPRCDPGLFDLGIPVLGICYGMQLTCSTLGADVKPVEEREFGRAELHVVDQDSLFGGVPEDMTVWMSHGDQVQGINGDFIALARTATCPNAAVRHRTRPIFGLQFHPEVHHTPYGAKLLHNFLHECCGCSGAWKIDSFLEEETSRLRKQVGTGRVICGLSGGVDSSVTAALLTRAISDQLTCIFVDNGLLRRGERDQVDQMFRGHFKTDLRVVDASEIFLQRLAGVDDPQKKREIIGHTFIDVFRKEAETIEDARFLAQGTLYPDVIESGTKGDGPAATIKAHHNVGGLPAELGFDLVEPLRDLFKDEVRRLGEALGLPEQLVWRHPFPGPGLAVRCLGSVSDDRLETLRHADAIFMEELHQHDLYREMGQAFAVLLPVRSVGVMGDGRTYEHVIALRAVTTTDFMTADWAVIDPAVVGKISTRIINEVRGVNRVVYDVSTKPPATIEWE